MKCPYCNCDNWDYDVCEDCVTKPLDEGCIEYYFAHCHDCDKEFVTKDVYKIVKIGTTITMEEYKKESE